MITGFIQFQRIIPMLNEVMAQIGEEMPPLDINFGVILPGMLIGTLIMTPLTFFIGAGIQYLGVRLFGGSGEFRSHLYLLALIQVPFTILSGVLSILGLVIDLLLVFGMIGLAVSIYTLIIIVRATKVVHDIGTGRAVAGILLPPILVTFLIGCLVMTFGSALISAVSGL
jgi:hypothetical protein